LPPDRPNVTLVQVAWTPIANTLALINLNVDTKEIIVTFRGSVILADYIRNGMLLPIPVSFAGDNGKVRVHGGFYVAADSLYEEIQDTVGQLLGEHQGFRLTFVGHSLTPQQPSTDLPETRNRSARITATWYRIASTFIDKKNQANVFTNVRYGREHASAASSNCFLNIFSTVNSYFFNSV